MLLFGPPYCRCHNDSGFRFPPTWLRVTTSGAVETCGDVTFSVAGSLYQRNIRRHVKKTLEKIRAQNTVTFVSFLITEI